MTESASKQAKPAPAKGAGAPAPTPNAAPPSGKLRLRDVWQVPALGLGIILLFAGALRASKKEPPPPYDLEGALSSAERLLSEEEPEEALRRLNADIAANLDAGAGDETLARFHVARADALYLRQRDRQTTSVRAAEAWLRDYEKAEELGLSLDALRTARMAEAMLILDRTSEALSRINSIPEESGDLRRRLLKQVVQRSIDAAGEPGPALLRQERTERAIDLLGHLSADPLLDPEDRKWAFARAAELRIRSGAAAQAVERLLMALQRLPNPEAPAAGELYLLLGRGYFEMGRLQEAARQLSTAQRVLPSTDPLQAEAGVLLGRIDLVSGRAEEASERFAAITSEFPDAGPVGDAWLGLAEAEGAMSLFDRARDAYEKAAERATQAGGPLRDALLGSLRERATERYNARDFDGSLALATLAERVAQAAPTAEGEARSAPQAAWITPAIALAHRALGAELLASATLNSGVVDWSRVDAVTRSQVRSHFEQAAERFRAHARDMIGKDEAAYADALWNAADAHERAGQTERAIAAFDEFAAGRPSDARRAAARFRAAQAHQSRGEFRTAADIYRSLIAEDPQSGERLRSYVPLARCLLADADAGNDDEAQRLLAQAVSGEVMDASAPDFRLALNELATLYHRRGRWAEAIERFRESLDRFPPSEADEPPDATTAESQEAEAELAAPGSGMMLRAMLADALRQSAREIAQRLTEAMPQGERVELERMREDRLREALALYDAICAGATLEDGGRTGDVERVALRNAFFYRADCAFDLGEYDGAIERYDAAANRYADEPASLVAMIQIVNAYVATERWDEARTANERARQRFRELPDDAFQRPDLPLERRHWERWLEASSILSDRERERRRGAEPAATAPGQEP